MSRGAPTVSPPRPLRVMMLGLRGCPDVQGGVERHVEQLAPELRRLGCEVEVVARAPYVSHARARDWQGLRITPLWSPRQRSLEAILHTLRGVAYAARRRPDILHIHAIGPSLCVPLARLAGLRVVTTHHGYDYDRAKWGRLARQALRAGEACGMRFANGRIAVSQAIAAAMQKRYGVSVDAVPNGVGRTARPATADALAAFGLAPGRYVLAVGRLVPEKRQLDLIAAFAGARIDGWKLAIVGAADHPDAYSRAVEATAAETPGVVMTGFQRGKALAELYAHAGCFVLPSTHEGLPIALLEALAYGLPCIASGIEANLEVGLQAERYFQPGDVAALAALLRRQAAAGPLSEAECQRQQKLLSAFDWESIAARTLAVYRAALGEAGRASAAGASARVFR